MTVIVNSGSTLSVPSTGLTITADSTIAAGGELDSSAGGTITGGFDLINDGRLFVFPSDGLTIDSASFTNQGTLSTFDAALIVQSSVDLTNLSGGTLTGGIWDLDGGGLDLLDGTISAVNTMVQLIASGDNVGFEVGPGGIGTQSIVNTITDIGTSGFLTVSDPAWMPPGPLTIDGTFNFNEDGNLDSGTLSVAGGITISANGTLTAGGEITSPLTLNGVLALGFFTGIDAVLQIDEPISGTGSILVSGGTLLLANPGTLTQAVVFDQGTIEAGIPSTGGTVAIASSTSGTGTLEIQNVASLSSINSLELVNATALPVVFGGPLTGPDFGALVLDQPSGFSGSVTAFNNDSTIVLKDIVGNNAVWNNDTLTVMDNTTTVYTVALDPQTVFGSFDQIETLQVYSSATFVATPDNINNTTTITASGIQDFNSVCYRAGTRIDTPRGLAVECLSPGDIVTSHFGGRQRVVWIGHREVDCRRHSDPQSVWPVKIFPDAFAPGQPHSDLYLSPDHAVFVDGVLIPVRLLINGTTIRSIETSRVTWYHLELKEHNVVLAEGLAVESYLDHGDRGFFTNIDAAVMQRPDFGVRTWELTGCAPLVMTGR